MERVRVESDAMKSVGYDADRRVLEIEFSSGEIYQYFDVPPHLHAGLMTADSHGQFFAEHIRNAGFDYEHVDEDEPPPPRARRDRRGLTPS